MLNRRREVETQKLLGVVLDTDETKLPLGSFTKLQNWIPGLLLSAKKKRGVARLDGVTPSLSVGPFDPCGS
jgi:hypothetical protein